MLTDPTEVEREMDGLLLRSVMEEAAGREPLRGDLVAGAMALGRRRRARTRIALGSGITAVMALGVFAATTPWSAGGTATPAVTGSDPSPAALVDPDILADAEQVDRPREPVHVEPSPGEFSMAELTTAERKMQEEFQQGAAKDLDDMLYLQGVVHPVDLRVSQYQLKAGKFTYPLTFSIRPAEGNEAGEQRKCPQRPAKRSTCDEFVMRDGTMATATTAPVGPSDLMGARVEFTYENQSVELSVAPDLVHGRSSPVTVEQLRTMARDSRITGPVKFVAAHPMEGM
ncbi:hypothetical protein OG786_17830 [Streptomyces sp. NBC_00101]|uniref:hypothetical protein n=1 Tax=Streptomyces sp. NBC_00101 TaxID=2975651 RepID=UPI00324D8DD5